MTATDFFPGSGPGVGSAFTTGETVVPHDTNTLAAMSRGLYVGGTGDVTVLMKDSSVLTFKAVPAGTLLPIRIQRVNATGTTATLMLALS